MREKDVYRGINDSFFFVGKKTFAWDLTRICMGFDTRRFDLFTLLTRFIFTFLMFY